MLRIGRSMLALLMILGSRVSTGVAAVDAEVFPAFPGAEGAGAYTPGGRGGQVIAVTTLEDYRPDREQPIEGSLRAAVLTSGPRTIIFRVAGNITLKTELTISEPFVTIAGQSAPAGGICLKNYELKIDTHDVVLRYLRIRPGDVEKRECDSISSNGRNVIIDHCSASWGIDEVLSTTGDSSNVTVQWCMITESLNRSVHHKGSHGYGSLISGPGEITYHHNVYAYHRSRNPRPSRVRLDFRNNLICGWGDRAGYCADDKLEMNYVANMLWPLEYSKSKEIAFMPGGPNPKIYLAENAIHGSSTPLANQWSLIRALNGVKPEDAEKQIRVKSAFATSEVTTETAEAATERILAQAGAALPMRDPVDARVVQQISRGSGQLINSQADVGGWPELAAGTSPVDTDGDGMPDDWELRYKLDPKTAAHPASDTDTDGYTDIEEYLNSTDPLVKDGWIYPPTIQSSEGNSFLGKNYVALSTQTESADIRYTLDGSLPSAMSPQYSTPFVLKQSATVRACTFLNGHRSHVRNKFFEQLTWRDPVIGTNVQPGLHFDYYEHDDWADFPNFAALKPVASGTGPQISIESRKREKGFAFRWSGFFVAPTEGIYTFQLRCSPLGQLLVHNQLLVESEGRKSERTASVALKRGLHPLTFQIYYKGDDDKTLSLTCEGPGIQSQPIPPDLLVSRRSVERK